MDELINKGINMNMRLIMLIAFISMLEIGSFFARKLNFKKLIFHCLEKRTL